MKLSEKGATRFENLYFGENQDLREIEFNQNDFKDCVVLTVEEALGIVLAMNPTHDDAHIKKWFIKRIKQAEKLNETK